MNSISIGFNLSKSAGKFGRSVQADAAADEMTGNADIRMPSWLDKVDTRVHTIVGQLVAVDAVLLFQIGVEASFDIVNDRLPAGACQL
jgi:hypothetical protein